MNTSIYDIGGAPAPALETQPPSTADPSRPLADPALRARTVTVDGVRPNWYNPPAQTMPPAQSGGLLGTLQQLLGTFAGGVASWLQNALGMFGSPNPSDPGGRRFPF